MARHLRDVKQEVETDPHRRGRIVYSRGPIIRNMVIGYVILALGLVGALAREEYRTDRADRQIVAVQKENDRKIAIRAFSNCRDVEHLKFRVRYNAMKNYRELRHNALLLDIPLTRALREKALADRNATLRRFRSEKCPRPLGGTP